MAPVEVEYDNGVPVKLSIDLRGMVPIDIAFDTPVDPVET